MHVIPTKADEWKRVVICLLKIYILSAFIVRDACLSYVSSTGNYSIIQYVVESSFFSPAVIVTGYVLSIVLLSIICFLQFKRGQATSAFDAAVFASVGLIFLLLNFQGDSVRNWVTSGAAIYANGWVVFCCFMVRRHFKMRALTCWIWACSINLIGEIGMQCSDFPNWRNAPDDPLGQQAFDFPASDFLQLYWFGYIIAGGLYVAGLVMAIRQLQSKDLVIPPPNTSMFIALGILALMIGLAVSVSVFRHPEFLPVAAINGVVCFVALNACQRQVHFAFLCLAAASGLTVVRIIQFDMPPNWQNLPQGFDAAFVELLARASFPVTVIWYLGMAHILLSFTDREQQQVCD